MTVTVTVTVTVTSDDQGCCHLSLSEVLVFTSLTPLFGLLGLGLHLGHLCGAQAKAQWKWGIWLCFRDNVLIFGINIFKFLKKNQNILYFGLIPLSFHYKDRVSHVEFHNVTILDSSSMAKICCARAARDPRWFFRFESHRTTKKRWHWLRPHWLFRGLGWIHSVYLEQKSRTKVSWTPSLGLHFTWPKNSWLGLDKLEWRQPWKNAKIVQKS